MTKAHRAAEPSLASSFGSGPRGGGQGASGDKEGVWKEDLEGYVWYHYVLGT